ncbi:MAG: hypothetical protein H7Z43_15180, partial [Clostridia bacterium]|nr:hypothetical protein [Deltaproteobacteria bacterium]
PDVLAVVYGLSERLELTQIEINRATRPVWDRAFADAEGDFARGHFEKAALYLDRVGKLGRSVGRNGREFLKRVSAETLPTVVSRQRSADVLESLKSSEYRLDIDDPAVSRTIRETLRRCGAEELARGFTINTAAFSEWGVDDVQPAPALAPLDDGCEIVVQSFPDQTHEAVRRFLGDYPERALILTQMLNAAGDLKTSELLWLVNRSRPDGDPYRAELPTVGEKRNFDGLKQNLDRKRLPPVVLQAIDAAYSRPHLLLLLSTYLTAGSKSVRPAATVARIFDALESPKPKTAVLASSVH